MGPVAYRPSKIGIPVAPWADRNRFIRKFHRVLLGPGWLLVTLVFIGGDERLCSQALSDSARVSVLTMLPGQDLYSSWGHTAIRIVDPATDIDRTYNFGTFDFNQPNFYTRFIMGRLDYLLSIDSFDRTLRVYRYLERSLIVQELRMSREEAQHLFDGLQINYRPENRAYRYDFFFDNCATRPRNALERALDRRGTLGNQLRADDTFRSLALQATEDRPWTSLGIDFLFGLPTDRVATGRERLFLPVELSAALDVAPAADPAGELVARQDTVLWYPEEETRRILFFRPIFVLWMFALLMLTASWIRRNKRSPRWLRWIDALLVLIVGFAGSVILVLWLASSHSVLKPNLNLLWAWPTHLLAVPMMLATRPRRLGRWYGSIYAIVAACMLGAWFLLPQSLPVPLFPVLLVLAVRFYIRSRDSLYGSTFTSGCRDAR